MIDIILEKFSIRIKKLRNEKGISQEEFAHEINMNRSYYGKIETGSINITLQNIQKIADGFDITLSELFKGM